MSIAPSPIVSRDFAASPIPRRFTLRITAMRD
jgi:hypothetical protein